jgi:hypothetical protein
VTSSAGGARGVGDDVPVSQRAGDGEAMVACYRCGKQRRAITDFQGYKICKTCRTPVDEVEAENSQGFNRARYERWQAMVRARERHRARRREMHKGYEISEPEYVRLLEAQQYLCAICDGPPPPGRPLSIDHDHVTGEVRGLLCPNCNTGLGFFEDSLERLERAADYLINPPREDVRD